MTMTYTNVLGRALLGDPAGHATMRFETLARAAREARKACELDCASSERHVDAALQALQTYKAIVADERMWWAERDAEVERCSCHVENEYPQGGTHVAPCPLAVGQKDPLA
jgi:hypothetical protein